jgi:hypothetical protein
MLRFLVNERAARARECLTPVNERIDLANGRIVLANER